MKRMHLIIAAAVVALALAGLIAVRHGGRTAATVPPVSDLPASPKRKASQPMDVWQGSIKADTRTDYAPDPAAKARLMEKLRQEEWRQRPLEGRN
jgi:cell division protein FtsN